MISKGIRGAITVDANTEDALKDATLELLTELVEKIILKKLIFRTYFYFNKRFERCISCKICTFRFWLEKVAMMCHHELDVPNSLPMCLRVMLVVNCGENFEPEFVYLKGAEKLRG